MTTHTDDLVAQQVRRALLKNLPPMSSDAEYNATFNALLTGICEALTTHTPQPPDDLVARLREDAAETRKLRDRYEYRGNAKYPRQFPNNAWLALDRKARDLDAAAEALTSQQHTEPVAGEVERYIARANELAEDGRYPWWSRLAEILSSYDALAAAKDAEWSELLNAAVADYNETKRTNRELVGKLSICERRISEMQATMSDMAQSWTRRSEAEEK